MCQTEDFGFKHIVVGVMFIVRYVIQEPEGSMLVVQKIFLFEELITLSSIY